MDMPDIETARYGQLSAIDDLCFVARSGKSRCLLFALRTLVAVGDQVVMALCHRENILAKLTAASAASDVS